MNLKAYFTVARGRMWSHSLTMVVQVLSSAGRKVIVATGELHGRHHKRGLRCVCVGVGWGGGGSDRGGYVFFGVFCRFLFPPKLL